MTTITQTGRNKLKLNRLTKTQFDSIISPANDELYLVDPEFSGGKVLGTNANGDVVETNINTTGVVTDVQINSTSVVSSGVASIPLATLGGSPGAVKLYNATYGLDLSESGYLYVSGPSNTQITNKDNVNNPLLPRNIELVTKVGVTTNSLTLTDAEKLSANTWLGSLQGVKVNGTALTKDANNAVDVPVPTSVKQIAKAGTGIEFNDRAQQNYTIVGTGVSVTSGVASGFTTSSYLSVDSPIKSNVSDGLTSLEMCAKVKVASGAGSPGGLVLAQQRNNSGTLDHFAMIRFIPGNGNGVIGAGLLGSMAQTGGLTLSRDTDYWVKFSWSAGTKLEAYLSTDGITYTKQAESTAAIPQPNATVLSQLTTLFTVGAGIGSSTTAFNLGSIDLKEAYVKVNGTEVWRGIGADETYIETTAVRDVQVNGTSVVTSGVANIPPVTLDGDYGVIRLSNTTYGLGVHSSGALYVSGATDTQITNKQAYNQPILPGKIDLVASVSARSVYDKTKAITSGSIALEDGVVFYTDSPSAATTYTIDSTELTQTGFTYRYINVLINMPSTPVGIDFTTNNNVIWVENETPDMSVGGRTYLLAFQTFDSGTTWIGSLCTWWEIPSVNNVPDVNNGPGSGYMGEN